MSYGVLVGLLALIISGFQLSEAWKERIAASEAMRNAEIAINNAKKAQCDLIQTGFKLADMNNNTYYRVLPMISTTAEARLEIFVGIDDMKRKLKEEHSKADCPTFPELFFPTKAFGLPTEVQQRLLGQ
jgi:hypothetical protein